MQVFHSNLTVFALNLEGDSSTYWPQLYTASSIGGINQINCQKSAWLLYKLV